VILETIGCFLQSGGGGVWVDRYLLGLNWGWTDPGRSSRDRRRAAAASG
jgi:hypothetical protein